MVFAGIFALTDFYGAITCRWDMDRECVPRPNFLENSLNFVINLTPRDAGLVVAERITASRAVTCVLEAHCADMGNLGETCD